MIVWFVLVVTVTWFVLFGFGRWTLDRSALSSRLRKARARTPSTPYDHDEIRALPAPVARYFEAALTPGRAFIESATLVEDGTLRTSPGNELRFRAITRVTVRRPGFISEAHVAGPFGLRVIDAYVEGRGASTSPCSRARCGSSACVAGKASPRASSSAGSPRRRGTRPRSCRAPACAGSRSTTGAPAPR